MAKSGKPTSKKPAALINEDELEELLNESVPAPAPKQMLLEPTIRMVEIVPKRDFKACIGGVWYFCSKDAKRLVPSYVRDIFLKDPTKIRY
jgi:hypothetical protein